MVCLTRRHMGALGWTSLPKLSSALIIHGAPAPRPVEYGAYHEDARHTAFRTAVLLDSIDGTLREADWCRHRPVDRLSLIVVAV